MIGEDLALEVLQALMPERPIRSYPAVLSTGADAMAWARSGAPAGSVVVADYQASPRGRAGLEWRVDQGTGLCFSMVLRPGLPAEREGWLYTVTVRALADVVDSEGTIEWPDELRRDGQRLGAVGIHAELGPDGVEWAVVNVLVGEASPPRGQLLRRLVESVEARMLDPDDALIADYLELCRTIGRRVRARLIPLGPGGVVISGRATNCKHDGALVIETVRGTHVAVRPQNLGVLEDEPPPGSSDQNGTLSTA